MAQEPKHISQLKRADQVYAQQQLQDALLTIVAAQGKPVTIPLSDLEMSSNLFRLKIEQFQGFLILTAEMAEPMEIIEPEQHEIDAVEKSTLQ
jgi:hypothetical protein